jgi:hypothetical protein
VPFDFSSLWSRVPTHEVNAKLPLLDSAGAKMSELEDVVTSRLEAEGRILAEAVAKHVLLCFYSHDPQVSLEPVVQGPAEGVQEIAQVGVRETVKFVVQSFERLPENAKGSPLLFVAATLLFCK